MLSEVKTICYLEEFSKTLRKATRNRLNVIIWQNVAKQNKYFLFSLNDFGISKTILVYDNDYYWLKAQERDIFDAETTQNFRRTY